MCEKVTDERYNTARTWYEGEKSAEELPDEDSDNVDDLDTECGQMRETIPGTQPKVLFATPLIPNDKEREKRGSYTDLDPHYPRNRGSNAQINIQVM